ncbi:MAG TPA: hypothetical protein PLA03_07100, partial [Acidobacteriota bacterium]|nr:hypothetical protein [Acidobacteriota bacterium]
MPAADEKATALREFREAKASAARRACEKLPSGNLLVGEILQPFFGTTFHLKPRIDEGAGKL